MDLVSAMFKGLINIIALLCLASAAQGRLEQLNFAGVGFVQTAQLASEAFPHAQRFTTRNEFSEPFYRQVYSVVQANSDLDGFTLTAGQASLARGATRSLALAIEAERLVINRLSAQEYSARYVVDAVILLFDFQGQNFLSAYPLRLAQTTSFDGYPSETDLFDFTASLFNGNLDRPDVTGDSGSASLIVRKFEEALRRFTVRDSYQFSIQVTDIELSSNAIQYLHENKQDEAIFIQWLASTFTAMLGEKVGIPVLPFVKGEIIDRKIAVSFEETGLIGLEIPKPSFEVRLRMRGFGTKLLEKSEHVNRYSFITGLGVDIVDATFEDLLISRNYQLGIPKNFTQDMYLNEAYWHTESLASLIDGILQQFVVPDRDWLQAHVPKAPTYKVLVDEITSVNQNVFNALK